MASCMINRNAKNKPNPNPIALPIFNSSRAHCTRLDVCNVHRHLYFFKVCRDVCYDNRQLAFVNTVAHPKRTIQI